MELFLPSFIMLLFAGGIVFFVIPKSSPNTILLITLILLTVAIYIHYDTFKSEYNINKWFPSINNIGYPLLMIAGVIGIISVVLGFNTGIGIPFLSVAKPQTFMTSRKNYKNIKPSEILDLDRKL